MSSSSSQSSSSPEPEPSPKLKRKQSQAQKEDDSDSDGSHSDISANVNEEPEQPVLSHAERRRQKRKAEKDNSPNKKRKLADGSSAAVESAAGTVKRQNSVWVGNLSFKTTQENLKTFFSGVGEITRVNLPMKAIGGGTAGPAVAGGKPRENRGFAYVDFATPEAKASAIQLSEKPLLGRKLLIKDGGDFTGRPAQAGTDATDAAQLTTHSKTAQKILKSQKQPPAPTLFLGNLGFETTVENIKEMLEAHRQVKGKGKSEEKKEKEKSEGGDEAGERDKNKDEWIRKVRMGTFEDSGLCKGFAFVDFTSIENATAALVHPKNYHLNGRNLVVEYAGPDAVRRGAPKGAKSADGAVPRVRKGLPVGYKPKQQKEREAEENMKEKTVKMVSTESTSLSKLRKDEREKKTSHYRAGDTGKDYERRKGPKVRPKPGAALALAKRESAAIIPSQGKKITF